MAMPSAFLFTLLLISFAASVVFSLPVSVEPLLSGDSGHLHRYDFPKDFVFGAATSAYQVYMPTYHYATWLDKFSGVTEGGRGLSIWDVWSHTPGKVIDHSTGDVAVDQYHHYEEDVELMAALNMDAYRFSISWVRIFPDGYGPEASKDGIDYYNRLIDSLVRKGIKPYVTLFHWELPQTLQDSFGGWMDRKIVDYYAMFAETCFAAFGDRVKNWITMNEPGMYITLGYTTGEFPPGRSSEADTEMYIVAHNFLLAHGTAVDIYRTKFQVQQTGVIGITVDGTFTMPLTNSSDDEDASQRYFEFQLGWFLDPLFFGDYPAVMRLNVGSRLPKFSADETALLKGSLDFIGLNHYTSRWATTGPGPSLGGRSSMDLNQRVVLTAERDGVQIGAQCASEWLYIYPQGLYGLVKKISERYDAPIYITENGMDYDGSLTVEDNLRDEVRVEFYQQYLAGVLQAIREGADVRAYFAWSLLDNFEWAQGYTKRFGLIYVDYNDDLKRYPKDSAFWFKDFLQRSQSDS
ncbi:unnamed protein product [Calypogeia fissa]